ncbi:hypothetical protein N7478_009029 [Penicillium angulare]|uniref:uncharacterized protein n=1 Tax=Penicillium angulare TaxID=116970 RepID=UPI00254159F3|nr:uncharacterized protein N7478_009029 [Penicillium angulare]KAJ5273904.1 hypothetical protein N7478_009029 [Penicillium angulare]
MSNIPTDSDSDSDVEFEDVPLSSRQRATDDTGASIHSVSFQTPRQPWVPTLFLSAQRAEPIRPGSEEETQLRGRLSTGIERINYRHMKSQMGMDESSPDSGAQASERRFEGFGELAAEVGGLVDILWASASPSIQVEGLISLAGLTEMALSTYNFDPEATLNILHKFDVVFAALCTGLHPSTHTPLPGIVDGRPLVTQTQKVRIRSLAEGTRTRIFSCLNEAESNDKNGYVNGNGNGKVDESEENSDIDDDAAHVSAQPWLMEAAGVYDKTLMLLADQGDGAGGEMPLEGGCFAG